MMRHPQLVIVESDEWITKQLRPLVTERAIRQETPWL